MPPIRHREYLANQIMAASSGQLIVLAYDGAIRFARVAREAMKADDVKTQSSNIMRAQDIVRELISCLDSSVDPEFAHNLSRLYLHIHGLLADANFKSDAGFLDQAIQHLCDLREAWAAAESQQRGAVEKAA